MSGATFTIYQLAVKWVTSKSMVHARRRAAGRRVGRAIGFQDDEGHWLFTAGDVADMEAGPPQGRPIAPRCPHCGRKMGTKHAR